MERAKIIFEDGGTIFGCKEVEGYVTVSEITHSRPSIQIGTMGGQMDYISEGPERIEMSLTMVCDTDSFHYKDNSGNTVKISRERLLRKLNMT